LVGEGADAGARREQLEAQREDLRESLVVQKTIDLLKANAKINEVIVDRSELNEEAEEQLDTDAPESEAE
jgi:Spy/CpxP family protein refolding chaperone